MGRLPAFHIDDVSTDQIYSSRRWRSSIGGKQVPGNGP